MLKQLRVRGSKFYNAASAVGFLARTSWRKVTGEKKNYPTMIQLPLTYRCNAKCVMCNIWKMDWSNEMDLEEFRSFMRDPIYSKVDSLGINGGEPTLVRQLPDFAQVILDELPQLKNLNMISHGFNRKLLYPALEKIYAACKAKGVYFHLSISLDGYGEMHSKVRGLKVWPLTSAAILHIQDNKEKYCDSIDVGCTVVEQNVDHLKELDAWAKMHEVDIKYRMGIENKRIESEKLVDQYSLLYHNNLQSAKEFFHSRYKAAENIKEKFKYFAIFFHLAFQPRKRLLGCHWQENGATMDSRGDLYYCAVASDKIGSLREEKGEDIFFADKNIEHRKNIIKNDCDGCIHDYHGKAPISSVKIFINNWFYESYYWIKYFIKARFA